MASNPEFLKEGAAINDFQNPDRVVVGVRTSRPRTRCSELYAPFLRTEKPFLAMTPESAELTKYVANALLSTKISFINEMANLCERLGGDINDVRRGIGHDRRIGFAVPVSRRRLRRQLLPQGRAGPGPPGPRGRHRAAAARRGR